MKVWYGYDAEALRRESGARVETVETDIDLYYAMALSLYEEIEAAGGRDVVCIMPVGPVFQYRRFIMLLRRRPLDLSRLHLFFMDEYLDEVGGWVAEESPLSFHGFIRRELIDPMPPEMGLDPEHIHFPDPADPAAYDRLITSLGGVDLCHAGVGIVGHLAFNEPISADEITAEEFAKLPSRVVTLTRETVTINSNTALRGALELIPQQAVTVGMQQILSARRLRIYFNRPWQGAVIRKALMLPPTPEFPVTLARRHSDCIYTMTEDIAAPLEFGLR